MWVADSTPLVDIGGRDEPGHDLDRVGNAARLEDGRMVVVDRTASELRFFDATGRYLSTSGRKGQGPGEFEFITSVHRLPGDTLFVFDGTLSRGSYLSSDGTFIRTRPTEFRQERSYSMGSAILFDRRLLGQGASFTQPTETSGPIRRDPMAILLMRDSLIDTLVVVPGMETHPGVLSEGGREYPNLNPVAFGRFSTYATDGSRIFVGTNDPDGIRVYDGQGNQIRVIRSGTPPEPVTEELKARRQADREASLNRPNISEQLRAERRKDDARTRYAAVMPFYARLLTGSDGSLWLERVPRFNDEGRRFVVYDSTGRGIATVRCPDRMRPLVVSTDNIIGVWRDPDDDVQHVRVYRLRKPG